MPAEDIKVVGGNSRLAALVALPAPGGQFTLRPAGSGQLPDELSGNIVIFSDPPSVEATRAAFINLLSRIPINSDDTTRIVLISSISAGFPGATILPSAGPYSQRKLLAEDILRSRADVFSTVIRLGNIREFGGWHDLFKHSKAVVLPKECRKIAIGNIDALRRQITAGLLVSQNQLLTSYTLHDVEEFFPRVIYVGGLLALYKNKFSSLGLKIVSKILRKISIYLPSADDLNCFLMDKK